MNCSDNHSLSPLSFEIGARSSPLSKAQVREVCDALLVYDSTLRYHVHYMTTFGDRDLATSLRTLDRTDFFTRDIDAWVLQGENRVGVHSAKDLPFPLANGLSLFCITRGVDSSDSLVLGPQDSLQSLKTGARIATSSLRREEMVKALRSDLSFCDIRGTIEQRLSKLESGEVQGVVIAEAAIIRLNLTHLNRIKLPGPTVEGQGKLAVVGRMEDENLRKLFHLIRSLF